MWRYTNAIDPANSVMRSATRFCTLSARSTGVLDERRILLPRSARGVRSASTRPWLERPLRDVVRETGMIMSSIPPARGASTPSPQGSEPRKGHHVRVKDIVLVAALVVTAYRNSSACGHWLRDDRRPAARGRARLADPGLDRGPVHIRRGWDRHSGHGHDAACAPALRPAAVGDQVRQPDGPELGRPDRHEPAVPAADGSARPTGGRCRDNRRCCKEARPDRAAPGDSSIGQGAVGHDEAQWPVAGQPAPGGDRRGARRHRARDRRGPRSSAPESSRR